MRAAKCATLYLHAHAPTALHRVGAEHVLMSSAYGFAAFMTHHPLGSAAVGFGYLIAGILSFRSQSGPPDA